MTLDRRTRWFALLVLCAGDLMIVLDSTIVNVALPSIQADLGFSGTSLAWVVNAYLLTFGGFLLLGGRLGDLFGHRRLFLIGIAFFTAASIACGLSTTQGVLVAARAIQGLGGAGRVGSRALADHEPVHGARRIVRRRWASSASCWPEAAASACCSRHPHGPIELALDLSRQRPDRGRRLRPLPEAAAVRPWRGCRRAPRRCGRGHRHGLADAGGLRDRERQRQGGGRRRRRSACSPPRRC